MTREEKMNKRREAGKTYKYKPNPYKEGTPEYVHEANERARKNVDHRLPYVQMVSMLQKVQNDLDKSIYI